MAPSPPQINACMSVCEIKMINMSHQLTEKTNGPNIEMLQEQQLYCGLHLALAFVFSLVSLMNVLTCS